MTYPTRPKTTGKRISNAPLPGFRFTTARHGFPGSAHTCRAVPLGWFRTNSALDDLPLEVERINPYRFE